MRTLLLMRGAPGAGKTTWIKQHGLEQYTLSPDNIRVLCSSTELQATGEYKISQARENENMVWDVLLKILEHRMSRGEFTVIDATCSKTKDIQKYKELAQSYRYRVYIVDFTDIPLETCLAQNKMRDEIKQVPSNGIKNIYARFATQKVPSAVKVIGRDELPTIEESPINLSDYKKIVFIGDIHGCYDTLMQYPDFKNGLNPEYCYIFLGDYIDRGNQNYEVLKFLGSIKDLPNVCLLEGNHERWIFDYGNGVPAKSSEFEKVTKVELENKCYDKKEARELYRKLRQFSHFLYNGAEVLACHAGIPNLKTNLLYVPTDCFIHGVGTYEQYKINAESWMTQTNDNQYLVHGHRNTDGSETAMCDRVFNLEGGVEFGGQLRIVELNEDLTWNVVELDDAQPITENLPTENRSAETVEQAIQYLRNNRFINEKQLGHNISSFNFTREAFYNANWNKQTVLARGLFINTENKTIVARSYEKFFKINETHETELSNLKRRLVFPVTAYVKENGFLAIIGYNSEQDDLFIASKSTTAGDAAKYIHNQLNFNKSALYNNILDWYRKNKQENVTLVFECVDMYHDPHIIEYPNTYNLFLLDAVKNELSFKKLHYEKLQEIASEIKCLCKERAFVLKDWDAFRSLYNQAQEEDYQYRGRYIEGFVLEDAEGFMTKLKTGYYNLWKKMRAVSEPTLRCGYITRTGMLTSEVENMFYGYCRDLYNKYYDKDNKEYPFKTDIISLRKGFESHWIPEAKPKDKEE